MKTEKIFVVIFVLGIILKLLDWTGGSILTVLSLSVLSLIYFPFGFYFFRDKIFARQNLTVTILAGIFLSIAVVGILFKLQYWNAAHIYISLGTVAAIVALAITSFLRAKSPENLNIYYKNMFIRSLVIVVISGLLAFTSTSTLLKIQYLSDPKLARLKTLHYLNPENKQYKKEHDDYLKKRDSLPFVN